MAAARGVCVRLVQSCPRRAAVASQVPSRGDRHRIDSGWRWGSLCQEAVVEDTAGGAVGIPLPHPRAAAGGQPGARPGRRPPRRPGDHARGCRRGRHQRPTAAPSCRGWRWPARSRRRRSPPPSYQICGRW